MNREEILAWSQKENKGMILCIRLRAGEPGFHRRWTGAVRGGLDNLTPVM